MKKIVLIESDEHFGSNVKAYLSKLGYEVEHVHRPCAVANTIRTFHPDIVLTDQFAPGTGGKNIPYSLRQLNAGHPSFKLVLFSSACEEAKSEIVDSGLVDGCLDRDMSLDGLKDALDSL